jgi:hypothetical protein
VAEFKRGSVVRVTVEIEYPDGSRKVADLPEPGSLSTIVLDPAQVPADDQPRFNVSETDWKQNPSMMLYPEMRGDQGIPFCTHNGCST